MSASRVSFWVKVFGIFIVITTYCLNLFKVTDYPMSEALYMVGGLEMLVLPIDISKIKTAYSHTNQK